MGKLFYLQPGGEVVLLKEQLTYPNGVALYKGELYVSEHLARRVIKFKITKPGDLGKAQTFTKLPPPSLPRNYRPDLNPTLFGPDGIEISTDGKIHIAYYGAKEILIYNELGELKDNMHTLPRYVTNMAFAPDGTLIISGAQTLDTILQEGVVYFIYMQSGNK